MYVSYFFVFLGCVLLTQSLPLLAALLVFQLTAHTVTGWQGNTVYALPELWRPGV